MLRSLHVATRKMSCSICGTPMTPRNSCSHEVGEIYDGEMCSRKVGKMV